MSRVLLQYVLPLVLPALVFAGWLLLTHKRGQSREELVARLQEGPWFWLAVAGFVLMAGGLAYVGLTQGWAPGGTYYEPHVEGGRVIPGTIK